MDRVVEIARCFAVNRDDGQIAEIAPPVEIRFRGTCCRRCRASAIDFIGKNVRQMMLADHDFDVDADFARTPENFDHASRRRQPALRKPRDFDIHNGAIQFRQSHPAVRSPGVVAGVGAKFFAQIGRQFFARRNEHFVQDARVVRQHDVAVRAVAEKSHEGRVLRARRFARRGLRRGHPRAAARCARAHDRRASRRPDCRAR